MLRGGVQRQSAQLLATHCSRQSMAGMRALGHAANRYERPKLAHEISAKQKQGTLVSQPPASQVLRTTLANNKGLIRFMPLQFFKF